MAKISTGGAFIPSPQSLHGPKRPARLVPLIDLPEYTARFPGTDCGDCGVHTCRQHARLTLMTERDVHRCPHLDEDATLSVLKALQQGVRMGTSRVFRNGDQFIGIKPCAMDGQITVDYRAPGGELDLERVADLLNGRYPGMEVKVVPELRMINAVQGHYRVHVYHDGRVLVRGLPEEELDEAFLLVDAIEAVRSGEEGQVSNPETV